MLDQKCPGKGSRRCGALLLMYNRHVRDYVFPTFYHRRPYRHQEKCIFDVVLVARREWFSQRISPDILTNINWYVGVAFPDAVTNLH